MTTQEKAQELFNKFADIEHLGVQGNYNGTWEWSSSLWRQQAKEAAVIAVDELLLLITYQPTIDYWNEVKHEINKL
jgi:hypothetical protein